MKIGIIGAGFTGLSAAYSFIKAGHSVTVFEKDPLPGGLAIGFSEKDWEWTLEKHYHHWFTNDTAVLNLAKEIGYEVIIKRPKTSIYTDGEIYQFDSPLHFLTFPKLSLGERLRMAAILGRLRYSAFSKTFETIHAAEYLSKNMGERPYKLIWEPLLKNKFGTYMNDISLAWFWARIKKRTATLAYPKGGFLEFARALANTVARFDTPFLYNTNVLSLRNTPDNHVQVMYGNDSSQKKPMVYNEMFDKVVVTLPSFFFTKMAPQLPEDYKKKLLQLKGLGAINLVLRLKKPFLNDGTYWLSVCELTAPVLAIVEHTNFMDKVHYNNEHLLYLGNYLPADHLYFSMTKEQLLKVYDPFLVKINPDYASSIIDFNMFTVPFAQPIIPLNYSQMIPSFETPLPNIYLANMQQVYPWDRGTNYAVELGEKVAKLIEDRR